MRYAVCSLVFLVLAHHALGQRYGETPSPPIAPFSGGAAIPGSGIPPLPTQPPSGAGPNNAAPRPSSTPAYTPIPPTPPAASSAGPRNEAFASRGSASSPPSQNTPIALMRGMLRAPSNSRLTGQPIRLEEVVSGAESRSDQTQRINAYWDLCSSTADYYLGLSEAVELNWHQQRLGGSNAALNEAENELRVRNGTSYLAAIAAQRRLASLMGRSTLPLPGDMPLCSSYNTRYSQVFAGRASEEARALDQLIPLRYAELNDAAVGVFRNQEFAKSLNQKSPNGEGMIKALELLALNRRAFVQIVKDYNRQITRYTELSTPGKIETNRLVAMLVERPNSSSSATAGRPADTRSGQSRPLTFRPGLQ